MPLPFEAHQPPSEDVQELLRIISEAVTPVDAALIRVSDVRVYFSEWAVEHGLKQGAFEGLSAGDFYRHFEQWCAQRGYPIPESPPQETFGRLLKSLGLDRSMRTFRQGRSKQLYRLASGPASYFRKWISENPTPADGGPFCMRNLKRLGGTNEP